MRTFFIAYGIATNPVIFKPRKAYIYMHFNRIKDEDEYGPKLDAVGLAYDYFARNGLIRVRLNRLKDYTDNKELLDQMAALAVATKA